MAVKARNHWRVASAPPHNEAHAGSRLKLIDASGRSRLICQPSSRTGENPPYGMIGRIEETSASFEARSAPRSHPTDSDMCISTGQVVAGGLANPLHGPCIDGYHDLAL